MRAASIRFALGTLIVACAMVIAAPGTSLAWNLAIQNQIVRDAVLLSPPEIRAMFEKSISIIPRALVSIPIMTKNGRRDPSEHFATAVRIASVKGIQDQRIVRELIALSCYPTNAVRPGTGKVFFKEVAASKSLFMVEFDGYQDFEDFGRILVNAREWSAPYIATVERYSVTNDRKLVNAATESLTVLYNEAVNMTVDCWVKLMDKAGRETSGSVVVGSLIAPKKTSGIIGRFHLNRRINFQSRMAGFLSQTYGVKELSEDEIILVEDAVEITLGDEGSKPSGEQVPDAAEIEAEYKEMAEAEKLVERIEQASQQTDRGEKEVPGKDQAAAPASASQTTEGLDDHDKVVLKLGISGSYKSDGREVIEKEGDPSSQKPAGHEGQKGADSSPAAKEPVSGKDAAALQPSSKPAPKPDNALEIQDDVVITGDDVKSAQIDESKIASTQVEIDRDAGFSEELSKAFGDLDMSLGSGREFQQAKVTHPEATDEAITADLDKGLTADEVVIAELEEKEQYEVESVNILPESESGTSGFLDSTVISKILSENIGGIRFCYEKAAKARPGLSGKVIVEFVIAEDGTVESAEAIKVTKGMRRVKSCILERVYRLRFPPPQGGKVTVSYPFVFEQTVSY